MRAVLLGAAAAVLVVAGGGAAVGRDAKDVKVDAKLLVGKWTIDDKEKRASLVDELPVASVLIYRFWQERRRAPESRGSGSRRELPEAARKSRQRLH